jgi:hypothetical protein
MSLTQGRTVFHSKGWCFEMSHPLYLGGTPSDPCPNYHCCYQFPLGEEVFASITTVTEDTELNRNAKWVFADPTDNTITLTLPDATQAENSGVVIKIKALNIANTVTVDTLLSQTIDGNLTFVFSAAGEGVYLAAYNGNWYIINRFTT